jgi:hypothetical protein
MKPYISHDENESILNNNMGCNSLPTIGATNVLVGSRG